MKTIALIIAGAAIAAFTTRLAIWIIGRRLADKIIGRRK